ncbi:MAG: ribbon-helix-helix protein, CopG family [Acidimicrobiales bacterium]
MRTTVVLDDDVAAAVAELRRQSEIGLSEALNELARRGLAAAPTPARFHQRSRRLGVRIDVSNVAEAVEQLDGPLAR